MNLVLPFRKAVAVTALDWDALYADHVGRVYNFFRYRVGDTHTAEDLTATVFEKAWRKREQFRGSRESFAAWLYTIARNVANDHYRKSPPLVALEAASRLAAPESTASQAEQAGEFTRLVAAINRLPERERTLITLKYGAELNNREIARQVQLSESNVGTILNRTLQKLRNDLEAYDEG
jgi:RNA polymerase sigma-70 factor (ECF subfamily)